VEKLRVGPRLLLACLISAAVFLGLAIWLVAAEWSTLAGTGPALAILLILAAGLLAAALAVAWAGLGRPAPVIESPPQAPPNPSATGDDGAEAWRQFALELAGTLDGEEVASAIARQARQLLGASAALVYDADQPRRRLRLLASAGAGPDAPTERAFDAIWPTPDRAAGTGAETGAVVVEQLPAGDVLDLPLRWREQLVGVLELHRAHGEPRLGTPARTQLEWFATQAASALGNARLRRAAQRQAERLAILHNASQAISRWLEVEEVYNATYEAVGQVMPNQAFAIAVLDDQEQTIEAAYLIDGGARQTPLRLPANAGLAGQVLKLGRPLLFHSPADWPPGVTHFGTPQPVQSAVVVPMRTGERILGILTTQAYLANAFSDEDVPLLATLANQAAAAIHNARIFQSSQRQARELDVLVKAQSAASASLDITAVLTAVAEQLGQALNVTSAYVIEVTDAYAEVVAEYYGPEAATPERVSDLHTRYPLPLFARANQAMFEGVMVTLNLGDEAIPRAERDHLSEFGGHTVLIVPLVRQGRPLGYAALWESRRERVFTDAEQRLAQTLAGNAAAALENARLYAAARRHGEQMRLVNEIGRDITGILEAEALLIQVARRLETSFGYYHARLGLIANGEVIFPARTDERRQLALPAMHVALNGPGIVAWVARNSRPRYVADLRAENDYLPNPLLPNTVSEAVVPLIAHGRTLGVLDAQSDQPVTLGPEEAATLEAISGQVAVAIDNARLFAEARQRAAEVSALLSTTLAVTSSMDLDARLQAIADHARRLVEGDSCTIYKLSPDARTLLPIIALDEFYAKETLNDLVIVGEGLIGQVAQSGAGVVANRVDLDPRAMQIPGTPNDPECLIVVPLLAGARVTGVMAVYREGTRDFVQHDFDLLSSFASQAAVAIENAELYQKLRERADSLQATYNELAEVDRLKDEMVQNISHELRTPLTFLKSYVELLLSGSLGPLQPEQERSLQVVMNKTDTLVRLVNDIITLQAVTPSTITRARLDLLELARAAADGVAALTREAGVELVANLPAGPLTVRGDALRLSQVFDNLLGNAVKFTERGGQIRLSVAAQPELVRVEVRDTGIGIAPESIERIFERFYQVDGSLTRRRGGIGLGLAICKLIVEVHGGQIGVESQVGAGSSFYFTLPLADAA
jgi:signal transduction histidine kinase